MNENARFHDNILPAIDKGVVEMGSQVIGSCFSFGKQYTYACYHRKQLNGNCYWFTRCDRHHLTAKNSPIILAIFGKPWVAKQNYRYLFHAVYHTSSTPSTSPTLSTFPTPSTSSTSLASSSGWTLCFTYSPTAIDTEEHRLCFYWSHWQSEWHDGVDHLHLQIERHDGVDHLKSKVQYVIGVGCFVHWAD